MIFPFDANKKIFSWWQMLLFALLLLGFLIFLFPKRLFTNSVLHTHSPSEVSIGYLKNLLAKDPSNLDLQMSLAEQEFQLGEIQEAKKIISPSLTLEPNSDFQWRILWLYFQITRVETFALPQESSQRQEKTSILKQVLSVLLLSPYLTADEQARLADDALALDLPEMANSLYKLAIDRHVKRGIAFFIKAARTALFTKDYPRSAQFFILAMKRSNTLKNKQLYFKKAVDSLNLSGNETKALKFAQENIDGLAQDTSTLAYLAKLALEAGEQKIAEQYTDQLLQLQYQDAKE